MKVLVSPLHLISVLRSVWVVLPEENDSKRNVSVQQAITIEERSRMQDFEVLLTRIIAPPPETSKEGGPAAASKAAIKVEDKGAGKIKKRAGGGWEQSAVQVREFIAKTICSRARLAKEVLHDECQ